MKILLTVHQFFPNFSSGTEILTLSVARELISRGHEVRVFTANPNDRVLADSDRFNEYDFEGMRVYCFEHDYTPMAGQTSINELTYENHLANDNFARILKEFRPDVVHFFHLGRLGTGLIEKSVASGVPAYMTPTDFWPVCTTSQLVLCNGRICNGPSKYAGNCLKHMATFSRKRSTRILAKWLPDTVAEILAMLSHFDATPSSKRFEEVRAISYRLRTNVGRLNRLQGIFSPSKIMTEVLIRHGVSPQLMINSAFGIGATEGRMNPGRSSPEPPLRLGFMGTLVHHKGCHVLLDAMKAIHPEQAVLKIYGRIDDYPDYYNKLMRQAGNRRGIEFCGGFDNSRIGDVMAELDALVVPSLWYENTPLVIYSAQAARCPVVASDYPGISEVIRDGVNGLLFEAGNIAELSEQLLRLVEDPKLLRQLGSNAQEPKTTSSYVDELLRYWEHSENLKGGF